MDKDKKGLDDLLDTLSFIALNKFMLPFNLRGRVNSLGLHVQERKAAANSRDTIPIRPTKN